MINKSLPVLTKRYGIVKEVNFSMKWKNFCNILFHNSLSENLFIIFMMTKVNNYYGIIFLNYFPFDLCLLCFAVNQSLLNICDVKFKFTLW